MPETKLHLKPPITEAVPISRLALGMAFFWFGIAAFMLILLIGMAALAVRKGDEFPGLVAILWVVFFVGIPVGIGGCDGYRYKQALKLERDHIIVPGTVIGFWDEDTSLGDQAFAPVFWVIFTLDGSNPIRQRVSQKTHAQLQAGDRITVKVLPDNKRVCRADLP